MRRKRQILDGNTNAQKVETTYPGSACNWERSTPLPNRHQHRGAVMLCHTDGIVELVKSWDPSMFHRKEFSGVLDWCWGLSCQACVKHQGTWQVGLCPVNSLLCRVVNVS